MADEAKSNAPSTADDGDEVPPMSPEFKLSLAAILFTVFIGSVGGIVVAPTLIFYLRQVGGSDAQYGQILAAAPLASFIATPLFGSWIDSHPGQYRKVFMFGDYIMAFSNLLYAFAVVFGKSELTVYTIFFSRILEGAGGGAGSIGMNWLTDMSDIRHLNTCIMLFAAAGCAGSACGPFVNTFISDLDTELNIFGRAVPVNANNGAGFLVAFFDLITVVMTYFFISDPPTKKSDDGPEASKSDSGEQAAQEEMGWIEVFAELASFKLFLPTFATFVAMANVNIVDSAFPPAVAHALGWGPVQVSAVMGANALAYFALTVANFALAACMKDTAIVMMGFIFWFAAGIMIDAWWIDGAPAWKFVAPLVIGLAGLPFIGPSTQTLFSKAMLAKDELEPIRGRLQSVFSMMGAFGGFVTPIFVGYFVLRSPEEVDGGTNPRELTHFDLYIAFFSGLCILGFAYERWVLHADDGAAEEICDGTLSERTSLLGATQSKRRSSVAAIRKELSARKATSTRNLFADTNMGGCVPSMLPLRKTAKVEHLEVLVKELDEVAIY